MNTYGCPGKIVSFVLHMEHLNRETKSNLIELGSNLTDGSVLQQSIGHTINMLQNFDKLSGIKEPSNRHSHRSLEKDMKLLLKQFMKIQEFFFSNVPGHLHHNFPGLEVNATKYINISDHRMDGTAITKIVTML